MECIKRRIRLRQSASELAMLSALKLEAHVNTESGQRDGLAIYNLSYQTRSMTYCRKLLRLKPLPPGDRPLTG